MRSHNLFQGHLWMLIPPCSGGSWHQGEPSFTGADVHSWSPCPFTASQRLFLSPLKEIICPPLQTPACLPSAPCHFKGCGFFCVNWLCSGFLQPFLCIPVSPPASCCLLILQPNTVCRPNTRTMPLSTQFNDTAHVNKISREFTRNLFNNQKLSLPVSLLPTKLPQL